MGLAFKVSLLHLERSLHKWSQGHYLFSLKKHFLFKKARCVTFYFNVMQRLSFARFSLLA
jgi:hypothetical protein